MAGLIHLYCGDGKGKTTAAVGLAVRASGAGKQVVFTQFFKDGSSSEVESIKLLGIRTFHAQTVKGFYHAMNEQQRQQARQDYTALFRQVTAAAQDADLLILDEIVSACNRGVVPEELVVDFLRSKPVAGRGSPVRGHPGRLRRLCLGADGAGGLYHGNAQTAPPL